MLQNRLGPAQLLGGCSCGGVCGQQAASGEDGEDAGGLPALMQSLRGRDAPTVTFVKVRSRFRSSLEVTSASKSFYIDSSGPQAALCLGPLPSTPPKMQFAPEADATTLQLILTRLCSGGHGRRVHVIRFVSNRFCRRGYFRGLPAPQAFSCDPGAVVGVPPAAQGDKVRVVAGDFVGAWGFVEKVDEGGTLHMRATSIEVDLVLEVDPREVVKHFVVPAPSRPALPRPAAAPARQPFACVSSQQWACSTAELSCFLPRSCLDETVSESVAEDCGGGVGGSQACRLTGTPVPCPVWLAGIVHRELYLLCLVPGRRSCADAVCMLRNPGRLATASRRWRGSTRGRRACCWWWTMRASPC